VLGIQITHSRPRRPPLTGQSRVLLRDLAVFVSLAIWQDFSGLSGVSC